VRIKFGEFKKYWEEKESSRNVKYTASEFPVAEKIKNTYERYCFGLIDFDTAVKTLLYAIEKLEDRDYLFECLPRELHCGCACIYKILKTGGDIYSASEHYKALKGYENGRLLGTKDETEIAGRVFGLEEQFCCMRLIISNAIYYLETAKRELNKIFSMEKKIKNRDFDQ
jgi:hypothetical protein